MKGGKGRGFYGTEISDFKIQKLLSNHDRGSNKGSSGGYSKGYNGGSYRGFNKGSYQRSKSGSNGVVLGVLQGLYCGFYRACFWKGATKIPKGF